MSEEITPSVQEQQEGSAPEFGKGDIATLLLSAGSILDSTLHPLSKLVSQALDSMTVVAKQVLDGVSNSLEGKK